MDIITNIINNLGSNQKGNSGANNGGSSGQNSQLLSNLNRFLNSQTISSESTINQFIKTGNNQYTIKLPTLTNFIDGVKSLNIKTEAPLDNIGNFKIRIESLSINGSNNTTSTKSPAVNIIGTVSNFGSAAINSATTPQITNFSSQINLSNLTNGQSQELANIKSDGIVINNSRENLNGTQLNAYTNNVNSSILSKIPPNINSTSLKLDLPISFSLKVENVSFPNSGQIQSQNANTSSGLIKGVVEFSPQNNNTIIRTEVGNFRVPGPLNIPNGSVIDFSINNLSNIKPESQVNQNIALNFSSLKLAIDSEGSTLQNLLNNLQSLPNGNNLLSRLFPDFGDKQSFSRALWFISSSSTGTADEWLGNTGTKFLKNNFQNSESVLSNLKEVFSLLKSLNTNTQTNIQGEYWYNYVIPFYDNKQMQLVSFYHQPKDQKANQKDGDNRKFIVEFEQSDLGKVIIEGLFFEKDKKIQTLDIIISSEKPVNLEFAEEIEVLFKDIASAYGFSGSLGFSIGIPQDFKTVINQQTSDGIVI